MKEEKKVLKIGGHLLVIDWPKTPAFGPKEGLVNPEEVKKMASTFGLSLKKEFAAGDYHYGLLFVKMY